MTDATSSLWQYVRRSVARVVRWDIKPRFNVRLRLRRDDEIIVSAETYRQLQVVARSLDCNVPAALDEVIRGFTP